MNQKPCIVKYIAEIYFILKYIMKYDSEPLMVCISNSNNFFNFRDQEKNRQRNI